MPISTQTIIQFRRESVIDILYFNQPMAVGLLHLTLELPGCISLKEKRSRLRPLLARLHREFNISAAELERLDAWRESVLGCAVISNDPAHNQRLLQQVVEWVEDNWPDVQVLEHQIEIV